jgi:hypothetical protein
MPSCRSVVGDDTSFNDYGYNHTELAAEAYMNPILWCLSFYRNRGAVENARSK